MRRFLRGRIRRRLARIARSRPADDVNAQVREAIAASPCGKQLTLDHVAESVNPVHGP
jgi:hypothetical protein